MSKPTKRRRRCQICRKPERIVSIGGIRLSNFPQHFNVCAKCINTKTKT